MTEPRTILPNQLMSILMTTLLVFPVILAVITAQGILEAQMMLTVASDPDQPLPTGAGPIAVQLGPLDGDATVDLVALSADGHLTVALNDGNNRWQSVTTADLDLGPLVGMKLTRVDGDGFQDLILQGPDSVTIASGDGSGHFTVNHSAAPGGPGTLAPPGGGAVHPDASLLNSDFLTDVVSLAPGSNEVLVFLADGGGALPTPNRYASGAHEPVAVAIGNFLAGLAPDLAVGHTDGTVTFLEGMGDGMFQPRPDLSISGLGTIVDLSAADLDEDGDADLAVSGTDQVTVLLNDNDLLTSSPIRNGDFAAALTGWESEVTGHATDATPGSANAAGGVAQLRENASFLVSLRQTFVVPPSPQAISLDIVSLGLDDPSGGLPDALEISLLDDGFSSLLPAFRSDATSLVNINPGDEVSLASGVTFDGTTVTVDISGLAAGTDATLYIDLIGNAPGTSSVASIDNVRISPETIYVNTFTTVPLAGPFAKAGGIAHGDVDGDGRIDLIVADETLQQLIVSNGDGAGGFTRAEVDLSSRGLQPRAVAAAPLTAGDPSDDVVVAMFGSDLVLSPLGSASITNVDPILTNLAVTSIAENGTATLTGSIEDPDTSDSFTLEVDWGDPSSPDNVQQIPLAAGAASFRLTHRYLDDNPSGTTSDIYSINLTLTDNDGGQATGAVNGIVDNVPPSIDSISGGALAVPGQKLTFQATFSDVGSLDTHALSWLVRRAQVPAPAEVATGSGESFHFVPDTSGTYTVELTVTDDDGGADTASQDVEVQSVIVMQDPQGSGQTILLVGGDNGTEHIDLKKGKGAGTIEVKIDDKDNKTKFEAEYGPGIDRLAVFALGGDDHVKVHDSIGPLPAELYGGAGEDHLDGGEGDDVLVGGAEDDKLLAGKGRDILIGGPGEDDLNGDAGDDVLIGGSSVHDGDRTALTAMAAEWSRTDLGYDDRVVHLTAGGGLNGAYLLNAATVSDDLAADKLDGQTDEDLFMDGEGDDVKAKGREQVITELAEAVTKFYVVDAEAGSAFRYGPDGSEIGAFGLGGAQQARGAASTALGDRLWVIDQNHQVFVFDSQDNSLLGSWQAVGLSAAQGIASDGAGIWVVDSMEKRAFHYGSAASRLSGSQTAASSFALSADNSQPSGATTDGSTMWICDGTANAVFVYDMAGAPLGYWDLDPDNQDASGIALGGADLWVVDRVDRAVYRYEDVAGLRSGSPAASSSFDLAAANLAPEGIADPPIQIGDIVTGSIDLSGEIDEFTFDATAGQSLFFDGQGAPLLFEWRAIGPSGGALFEHFNFGDQGPLILTETGTYRLEVDPQGDRTGAYQFQIHEVPPAVSNPMNIGDLVIGSIDVPGEMDEFTFDATAGQSLFFDGQAALILFHWRVIEPSGGLLFEHFNFGDQGALTLDETGTYRLEVDPAGDRTGEYQFRIFDVPETSVFQVAPEELVTGAILVPGEVNVFLFEANAGQSLFLDSQVWSVHFRTALEAPSGQLVFNNASGDEGPVTLVETGTYRLTLDPDTDAVGPYQFVLWEVPPDIPQLIPLDTPIADAIGVPGQIRTFQFEGAAGQEITFDVIYSATAAHRFALSDPAGNEIFSNRFSGQNVPSLPETGTYTLLLDPLARVYRVSEILPSDFSSYHLRSQT